MQVILGAGLAGLSLAVALVRAGVNEEICVIDRRTTFGRDRTWCTWAAPDTPWLSLARHRWHTWEVRGPSSSARSTSRSRPYVHIDSADFYAAALDELARAPQVTLRLGETVLELGDGRARTDVSEYRGTVHDALALASPALRAFTVELWQGFLGWEVETERAVFEPGVATLMDFVGPLEFVYVLPFSATRALVEHTTFAPRGASADARRDALRAYLSPFGAYEITHEERGRIPMTTQRLPARRGAHTSAIGTGGGAVRASSGYAFSRIQDQVAAVARAVATGAPLPARAGSPRRFALDTVFLRAATAHPDAFGDWMAQLVRRVPGDAFARFMTDRSTLRDELRVMAALPPAPFVRALSKR